MKNRRTDTLQKGEHDFIENVVKAIVSNDLSKKHYLLNDRGMMKYESVKIDDQDEDVDVEFRYENGEPVKIVCVFGKELIKDFHYKAGSDDLAAPWARRSVKLVIEHGKTVADKIEW